MSNIWEQNIREWYEKSGTAIQQLRKIQQLKLEAVARAACGDNHYSDILPEVHQQTCELNEIDGI